jgi:hypothetical protein
MHASARPIVYRTSAPGTRAKGLHTRLTRPSRPFGGSLNGLRKMAYRTSETFCHNMGSMRLKELNFWFRFFALIRCSNFYGFLGRFQIPSAPSYV